MSQDSTAPQHAMRVGDRAHRIIAQVLHEGAPDDRAQRTLALTRAARSVFDQHPVAYRPREALLDAVTAAGVYLRRFRPEPPWELLDIELTSGSCRFDLAFTSDADGVVIDEVKLGVGRTEERTVRDQVARYLEEGTSRWGGRFMGVRLCTVHEPTRSRLHLPSAQLPVLLTDCGLPSGLSVR